jgi:hypothetical protein
MTALAEAPTSIPVEMAEQVAAWTCNHAGCDRGIYFQQLCRPHYRQIKLYGETWDNTSAGRFWRKVEKTNTCWLWVACVDSGGYGRRGNGDHGQVMAHRFAYELLVGPIPEGLDLDHLCHTNDRSCKGGVACRHRRCVNPAHLEPVTPAENTRRALKREDSCARGHAWVNPYLRWDKERQKWHRACRECNKAGYRRRYEERKRLAA